MRRAFVSNIILLLFVNVLIKPFFIFGIDLTVQKQSAAGEYGVYFALLNWTYLFQIISDFGLQNYNARHVSSAPHLLQKYFPNLLLIKILLSVFYFITAMTLAVVIGGYTGAALPLLAVLLVNQILVQLILFLRSNIAGLGFYRIDSWLSALDKLLMLFFCGGAIWWFNIQGGEYFPMMWFATGQTAALVITVAVVYGILFVKSDLPMRPDLLTNIKKGWPVIRYLFRESLPFAMVILLMSAYTRLDGILLERILPDGAHHTSIFASGYRLLDALNMFGYLFASLLLPMFSRMLANNEAVRPLTMLGFKLIWIGCFAACTSIFFFRQEIIEVMFSGKPENDYRAGVCGVLIWNFAAICVTYIFSTLLTAAGQLKAMNKVFVVGLIIDISLNFLLIPDYKAYGAAIASLCTQSFVATGMVILCMRIFDFKIPLKGAIRLAVFSGGTLLLAIFFSSDYLALHWIVKFLLCLGTAGLLALPTGMFDWQKGLQFLKRAS